MPSPVDKYFKEVKKGNPGYTDAQAWATAWSIFCKNVDPGNKSCHLAPEEYLKKASVDAMVKRVALKYSEALKVSV